MTKLLFILSGDFGELFDAVYFVTGTAYRPVLPCPKACTHSTAALFPFPLGAMTLGKLCVKLSTGNNLGESLRSEDNDPVHAMT